MQKRSSGSYQISGRIIDEQGQPRSGLTLQVYVQLPRSPELLVHATETAMDGTYTLSFPLSQVQPDQPSAEAPSVFLMVFDGEEEIGARRPVPINQSRRTRISRELPGSSGEAPTEAEPSEPPFQVSGVVSGPDGRPLSGVVVRAWPMGLREEIPLSDSVSTDKTGRYTITYTIAELEPARHPRANLIVRASDAKGRPLAESPVRFRKRGRKPQELQDSVG